jgi:hypothetical protein
VTLYLKVCKIFVLTSLTFAFHNSSGQSNINIEDIGGEALNHIDSLGKDKNPKLTNYESRYLNIVFSNSKNDFDFTSKSVAFVTGNSGRIISSKQQYFELEKHRIQQKSSLNGGTLLVLNEDEKVFSGGYDAVIIYWSKVLPKRKAVVNRLHGRSRK